MNIKDVSKIHGLCKRAVNNAIKRGSLKAVKKKIGKFWVWDIDEESVKNWDPKKERSESLKRGWTEERRKVTSIRSKKLAGVRRDGTSEFLDRETVQIDQDDHCRIVEFGRCWFIVKRKTTSYVCCDYEGKRIYLHRWLLDAPPNRQVDHINGDGLDNRRCNLRIVTPTQNNLNQHSGPRAKSGYTGVRKVGNVWNAYYTENGERQHNIGCWPTRELAACARDYYVVDNDLDTNWLNFPKEPPHPRAEVESTKGNLRESGTGYQNIRYKQNAYEVSVKIAPGKRKYLGRFATLYEARQAQESYLTM